MTPLTNHPDSRRRGQPAPTCLFRAGRRARESAPDTLELLVVKLARGMGLLERLEQISRGVGFFHVVKFFPHLISLHERNDHQHHQNAQAQIIGGLNESPGKGAAATRRCMA